MKIKVINKSNNELPLHATELSAGMDLQAFIPRGFIVINPGERKLIPTGLYSELPKGYEVQIRPRSGMALKKGITVLNSPGTIDGDYRGEWGVILHNNSTVPFIVNNGDRVAQAVLNKYEQIEWETTNTLSKTERGEGGFGHTDEKKKEKEKEETPKPKNTTKKKEVKETKEKSL